MKKTIVVSAVNLRKGGTLTILRNCLEYLSTLAQTGDYRIVALVHKKELAFYPGIEYIESTLKCLGPYVIGFYGYGANMLRCIEYRNNFLLFTFGFHYMTAHPM